MPSNFMLSHTAAFSPRLKGISRIVCCSLLHVSANHCIVFGGRKGCVCGVEEACGVRRNPARALDWYRRAADQGQADAQAILGAKYYAGEDVERDLAAAYAWTTLAAERGHADAMHNLAVMYIDGESMAQDYAQALRWALRAAEQGHALAAHSLATLYFQGLDRQRQYRLGGLARQYLGDLQQHVLVGVTNLVEPHGRNSKPQKLFVGRALEQRHRRCG